MQFELKLREHVDVFAITETWLTSSINNGTILDFHSTEYNIIRCDRPRKKGGGLALVLKKHFDYHVVHSESIRDGYEILTCDIHTQTSFRIIVIYRTPTCSHQNSTLLAKAISDLVTCSYPAIIVGDFNLPESDWDLSNILPNTLTSTAKTYYDLFITHDMKQLIDSPTRYTDYLDLLLTNEVTLISNLNVGPGIGSSDHNLVKCEINIDNVHPKYDFRRVFDSSSVTKISNYLQTIDWVGSFSTLSRVDEIYEMFIFIIQHSIDKFVEWKKVYTSLSAACPQYIVNMSNWRTKLWMQAKSKNDTLSWDKYKGFSCKFDKVLMKYQKSLESKIIGNNNPSAFYRYIKTKTRTNSKTSALLRADGTAIISNSEKANLLADIFEKAFTRDNGITPPFTITCSNVSPFTPDFSASNIYRLLTKTSISYSSNPDDIPNALIKEISSELAAPLEYIFNLSYTTGNVPTRWRQAIVTAIPKKQPHSDPNNYRPISISSQFCKIFERILSIPINNHIENNNLLSSHQHGFRKGRSIETQMLECMNDWTTALENKQSVDVLYLDFAKAFDRVCHTKLLFKLTKMQFCPFFLKWLKNYLTERKFIVKVGPNFSSPRNILSGVPQGSVLSAVLFALYTSEIPNLSSDIGVKCKVYADDTKLYEAFSDSNTLQIAFDRILDWAIAWQLPLSELKTLVLHIGKHNPNIDYKANGHSLNKVKEYVRDLGFIISPDLSFREHINTITLKGNNCCYNMFKILKTQNISTLIKAYITYIRPILECGTTVFSPTFKRDIKKIESVQNNFTRKLYLRSKGILYNQIPPGLERNKNLGLQSLETRRKIFDVRMVRNIIRCKIGLNCDDFFVVRLSRTRGEREKINFRLSRNPIRSKFFIQRAGSLYCNSMR